MNRERLARWQSFVLALSIGAAPAACSDGAPTPGGEPSSVERLGVERAALTASITIRRGAGGKVADATINAQRMRQNFGDDRKLVVSKKNEALLRFDVSAIPPSAVINSATLTLYMHGHDDGDEDDCERDDRDEDRRGFAAVPIKIHLANEAWVEGRVTFAKFDQAFDPTAAGILVPVGKNTYKSIDLKAAVQAWVGGGRDNHGIVIRTTSRKRWAFASSENSRSALRPSLTISYSTPDEHCAPNPCENGGTCTNGWSGFTCACAPGYTGPTCAEDIDDCVGDPCLNGGACTDDVSGYTCGCVAGYAGENCETNVDECAADPCQNGGVCTDGVNAYTCECAVGYTGASCETLIDNCAADPCLNGGVCTSGVGSYTCACPAGFTGVNCETNVDDCASGPCLNGGACDDEVNAYECNCAAGFSGPTCAVDIDECEGAPCLNGGVCDDGIAGYECDCASGYTGTNCEVNVNDCVGHACQNGMCVDGVAGYTCACADGYSGLLCDTNVDECSPNPCQNGGVCTDGVNTFTCDCASGYTGPTCGTAPCVDPPTATVLADLGDTVAPVGFEYRGVGSATASSPNQCPEWSCGVGMGAAAGAIDDVEATAWNSGTWDFGGGFNLTITFDPAGPARSFHGLHMISDGWPTDDFTYTVTATRSNGEVVAIGTRTATIAGSRDTGELTGVDVGFSAVAFADIVSIKINVAAPYVSSGASTWVVVREVQLIQPAGCNP